MLRNSAPLQKRSPAADRGSPLPHTGQTFANVLSRYRHQANEHLKQELGRALRARRVLLGGRSGSTLRSLRARRAAAQSGCRSRNHPQPAKPAHVVGQCAEIAAAQVQHLKRLGETEYLARTRCELRITHTSSMTWIKATRARA